MAPPKSKKPGSSAPAHEYRPDDVVLSRLSGYPFWPSIVVSPNSVPDDIRKQKRSGQHIVRFMPAGDYGFIPLRDMKPLSKEDISKYLDEPSHQKSKGDLRAAYEIARDPSAWVKDVEEDLRRANEAAAEEAENEDELEDDDEKPAKKRKSNSGGKVRDPKKPGSTKKSKDSAKAETGKKRKADGSAKEDKDDDAQELDPDSKRVKGWRHELQRNFLGKEGVIVDALDKTAEVFDTLEAYNDMTSKQLQDSKILKVLKKIIGLKAGDIPAEAEEKHQFKKRSEQLHNKWQDVLNGTGGGEAAEPASKPEAEAPATNGSAEKPEQDTAAPAGEEKKEEDKPAAPAEA